MGARPKPLPTKLAHPLPPTEDVQQALEHVLGPLVRLLLASGSDYTQLTSALKLVFLEQARRLLMEQNQKCTDSALSALSGVHRKDIRAWRQDRLASRKVKEASISSQVFARWVHDPLYRDRSRRPKALPRSGPAPSFETLARTVTQDVHAYTVLTELIRLGLVEIRQIRGQEMVVPEAAGYVPPAGSRELVELFGANLADHAQAAVGNLLGQPALLEQSVFADGMTPESARELGEIARRLWSHVRAEMITEALRRYEADQGRPDATHRVRLGTYFWTDETSHRDPEEDLAHGEPDSE